MENLKANKFSAKIEIMGINLFVFLPEEVLFSIFTQSKKDKGKIPVRMKIDGHEFCQTLIKYSGHWRLYLNTPMRKAAKKELGDLAHFEVDFDPIKREIPLHAKFEKALEENQEAKEIFSNLRPSLRKEIIKYLSFLKTEESVNRNVVNAVQFLLGKQRFIGRDKP